MNDQQRDSTAKYLYDLSKGIALLTVIKPLWEPGVATLPIIFGVTATCLFFSWGMYWKGGNDMDTFGWIMLFLSVVAGIGTFLTWKSNKKHRGDHKTR